MAEPASARRGQPLIALSAVLLGWVGVRMLVWTPLFEPAGGASAAKLASTGHSVQKSLAKFHPMAEAPSAGDAAVLRAVAMRWDGVRGSSPSARDDVTLFDLANFASSARPKGNMRSRGRGGSQIRPPPIGDSARWSGDGWLLLRDAGGNAAQAPGAASYGASQAGAVLRYRLGQGGPRSGYAYLRGSFAIDAPGRDREVALGLGVRPIEQVPVRALAEVRAQGSASGSLRLRPVVAMVTELPWQDLPLGLRGEVYAQAGYAGGRNGTAFFDAQALADRPVAGLLPKAADLRVGVGAWAGGQKDATRVDLGPRASIGLNLGGGVAARLALDWRIRVAGNARPASGPALTVASSF